MVGRLDDWVKVLVERDDIALDPDAASWAGIAAFKRAYGIYQERGYRTRLLAAAIPPPPPLDGARRRRRRADDAPRVAGPVQRERASTPQPRIDVPVDAALVDDLLTRVPDFRRAYEPDGLATDEFDTYGATVRTLRSFIEAYHALQGSVRDLVLPNPDVAARLTRLLEDGKGVDVQTPRPDVHEPDRVFGPAAEPERPGLPAVWPDERRRSGAGPGTRRRRTRPR